MIYTLDPERITDRMFGGPHLRAFVALDGDKMQCPKTGKVWSRKAMAAAWQDGVNCPAVAA